MQWWGDLQRLYWWWRYYRFETDKRRIGRRIAAEKKRLREAGVPDEALRRLSYCLRAGGCASRDPCAKCDDHHARQHQRMRQCVLRLSDRRNGPGKP